MTAIPAPPVNIPTTRQIIAGAGLTGGGDLSADRTVNAVAGDSSLVVNADEVHVNTAQIATVASVNLKADKTYVDSQDATKADKTYVDSQDALAVPQTRQILTGLPLNGGGPLSTNLTLGINNFANGLAGAVPPSPNNTNTFLRADGQWTQVPTAIDTSGWWIRTEAAAYVNTAQIAITGVDLRPIASVGTLFRYYQLSAYWYGYISAISYATNVSTVTLVSNTTVANSPITEWGISYQFPEDFPAQMPYTPGFPAGFSTVPTGYSDTFAIINGWCTYSFRQTGAGVSNANNFQITPPIRSANVPGRWVNSCAVVDNGTLQSVAGLCAIGPNSVVMNIFKDSTSTNIFTTTGNKRCDGGVITYPVRG